MVLVQPEKGGVPSPGGWRGPASSGGFQVSRGLVHESEGKMEREIDRQRIGAASPVMWAAAILKASLPVNMDEQVHVHVDIRYVAVHQYLDVELKMKQCLRPYHFLSSLYYLWSSTKSKMISDFQYLSMCSITVANISELVKLKILCTAAARKLHLKLALWSEWLISHLTGQLSELSGEALEQNHSKQGSFMWPLRGSPAVGLVFNQAPGFNSQCSPDPHHLWSNELQLHKQKAEEWSICEGF
ncbi:hypothetical protein L3Q82_017795 [Scortum barcoo]|uniref:Uncharacterized protein n=1 Tax=Scortum barcoo TaxID=214431 RepID=A0ACB8VMG5_9TELE|nr:hypothetical protein L3Q82_017795 [Scortum barcoo]